MGFATRTLRDTVVNAAGAGGTVTILVNIEDDTGANNAILDASALEVMQMVLSYISIEFGGH